MMTDPIADMLTRIRNAVRIERPHVLMPHSSVKKGLAEVLKREGYIWDWNEEKPEGAPSAKLAIDLKYGPNGERVIRHIKRVSKPGRRVYTGASEMPTIKRGRGVVIVSTSKGLMTGKEAKQQGLKLAKAIKQQEKASKQQVKGQPKGTAFGPLLIGWLYDQAGSYRIPYAAAAVCSTLGMIIFAVAGPATVAAHE